MYFFFQTMFFSPSAALCVLHMSFMNVWRKKLHYWRKKTYTIVCFGEELTICVPYRTVLHVLYFSVCLYKLIYISFVSVCFRCQWYIKAKMTSEDKRRTSYQNGLGKWSISIVGLFLNKLRFINPSSIYCFMYWTVYQNVSQQLGHGHKVHVV